MANTQLKLGLVAEIIAIADDVDRLIGHPSYSGRALKVRSTLRSKVKRQQLLDNLAKFSRAAKQLREIPVNVPSTEVVWAERVT